MTVISLHQSPQPGYLGRVTNLDIQGGLIGGVPHQDSPQPGDPGRVTNLDIQGGLSDGSFTPPITPTRISWAGDQPGHLGRLNWWIILFTRTQTRTSWVGDQYERQGWSFCFYNTICKLVQFWISANVTTAIIIFILAIIMRCLLWVLFNACGSTLSWIPLWPLCLPPTFFDIAVSWRSTTHG